MLLNMRWRHTAQAVAVTILIFFIIHFGGVNKVQKNQKIHSTPLHYASDLSVSAGFIGRCLLLLNHEQIIEIKT